MIVLSYTLVSKKKHHDSTVYTIHMTSLKWLDDSEVDKTIWWHMVTIAAPKVYKNAQMKKSCFLLLAGGSNDNPEEPAEYSANQIRTLAVTTGSFQRRGSDAGQSFWTPKKFMMETFCATAVDCMACSSAEEQKHPFGMKNITENSLFAYILWRFINDPTASLDCIIQFPMVKATVRAMDTVTDFLVKQTGGNVKLTKFMLLGSSKRGWIAWLTAAVDKRVVSFVSVVMDILNLAKSLHHQYRSYCGWSFALAPFYFLNITQQIDHPRFELIASNIDPLKYNNHYINTTKYLLVASGDEVGQADNSYYYFNQLQGEKYLRIMPNKNHDLGFHNDSIGVPTATFYTNHHADQQHPEATYSSSTDSREKLIITSELHIIPETFPCEDCVGEGCYSKLV
ncbi:autocrine proliferation repressor protein A-like [Thamnophis elegans]|uniref:autocrine proliferation repressor protein A-like n=1 Tax=Thamnophis elegans TaxID=35005 RepID=UPI001378578F|nr:autocrine proliferation repressor protein A-like [Thamnophis elegans]